MKRLKKKIEIPVEKWDNLLFEFKCLERKCDWILGDSYRKGECGDLRKVLEDITGGEIERFT